MAPTSKMLLLVHFTTLSNVTVILFLSMRVCHETAQVVYHGHAALLLRATATAERHDHDQ